MSPAANFDTIVGVPDGLKNAHGETYHLSKAGWAFLLIGLFFTLLSIVPTLVSLCLPNVKVLNAITGAANIAALLFTTLAASLLTPAYVIARNKFRSAGASTHLGQTMIAFVWTSVFLLFLSAIFSGVGCFATGGKREKRYSENNYETNSSHDETYGNDYAGGEKTAKRKKRLFFQKRTDPEAEAGFNPAGTTGAAAPGVIGGANLKSGNYDGAQARGVDATAHDTNSPSYGNINVPTGSGFGAGAGAAAGAAAGAVLAAGTVVSSYATKSKSKSTSAKPDTAGSSKGANSGVNGETLGDVTPADATTSNKESLDPASKTATTDTPYDTGVATGNLEEDLKSTPYDTGIATGSANARDNTGLNTTTADAATDSSNKGLWTTAAGLLGMGGVATTNEENDPNVNGLDDQAKTTNASSGARELEAAASDFNGTKDSKATDSELNRTDDANVEYLSFNDRNTDHGRGATHAGLNAETKVKHLPFLENKSTTLPVKQNGFVSKDSYGNRTAGYQTGVPDDAAAAAAAAAGSMGTYIKKDGIATRAEDTYTGAHIGKRTKKDLTDTEGFEPTDYYERKTGANADVAKVDSGVSDAKDNTNNAHPAGDYDYFNEASLNESQQTASKAAGYPTDSSTTDPSKAGYADNSGFTDKNGYKSFDNTGEYKKKYLQTPDEADSGLTGAKSDSKAKEKTSSIKSTELSKSRSADYDQVGESSGHDKSYKLGGTTGAYKTDSEIPGVVDPKRNRNPISEGVAPGKLSTPLDVTTGPKAKPIGKRGSLSEELSKSGGGLPGALNTNDVSYPTTSGGVYREDAQPRDAGSVGNGQQRGFIQHIVDTAKIVI